MNITYKWFFFDPSPCRPCSTTLQSSTQQWLTESPWSSLKTSISNIQWEKQSNDENIFLFVLFVFCLKGSTYLIYTSSLGINNLSCAKKRDDFVRITLHRNHEEKVLLGWLEKLSKMNIFTCFLKNCLYIFSHFMLKMRFHFVFTHTKRIWKISHILHLCNL